MSIITINYFKMTNQQKMLKIIQTKLLILDLVDDAALSKETATEMIDQLNNEYQKLKNKKS